VSERTIKSPCISVCVLNDEDVCEGCWRTMDEISRWQTYDDDKRREVILLCKERRQDSGMFL